MTIYLVEILLLMLWLKTLILGEIIDYFGGMEELYEGDIYLSPKDNGGYATHEIYSDKDGLLYSNEE